MSYQSYVKHYLNSIATDYIFIKEMKYLMKKGEQPTAGWIIYMAVRHKIHQHIIREEAMKTKKGFWGRLWGFFKPEVREEEEIEEVDWVSSDIDGYVPTNEPILWDSSITEEVEWK